MIIFSTAPNNNNNIYIYIYSKLQKTHQQGCRQNLLSAPTGASGKAEAGPRGRRWIDYSHSCWYAGGVCATLEQQPHRGQVWRYTLATSPASRSEKASVFRQMSHSHFPKSHQRGLWRWKKRNSGSKRHQARRRRRKRRRRKKRRKKHRGAHKALCIEYLDLRRSNPRRPSLSYPGGGGKKVSRRVTRPRS